MKSILLALFITSGSLMQSTYTKLAQEIYICNSNKAVAYHSDINCCGLQRCTHGIEKVSLKEAQERGLRACKICY
jgi:hypothetical protein